MLDTVVLVLGAVAFVFGGALIAIIGMWIFVGAHDAWTVFKETLNEIRGV